MISKEANRRLTTILMADVVGYSRLMAADDEGTVAQLKANRKELVLPKQEQYHGRTVKLMGDGALMEFGSVVDAVNFAIDVQRANLKRNEEIPQDQQISYRMGISIGDIIVDGEDIYGDEVNISARLESLCEPDCIYLTEDAYHQAENKVDAAFEALGKKSLKNIPEPVSVYRVLLDSAGAGNTAIDNKKSSSGILRTVVIMAVIAAVSVAAVLYSRQPQPPADHSTEVKTSVPTAERAAILPEAQASIAVLPFDNMSGDPEQEYFSDGISEDIITDLSQLSNLAVISRNSSFTYKGTAVKMQQIGQELGVKYVLEGSVRKAGNRIRINAQLVDTNTGHHLWAERYDRELVDVFGLQDEITGQIVNALSVQLSEKEKRVLGRVATGNFKAYDLFLQGQQAFLSPLKEDTERAVELYRKAISFDPDFARAYGALSVTMIRQILGGYSNSAVVTSDRALEMAEKAVSIDPDSPQVLWALGYVYMYRHQPDKAVEAVERAISLSPSYADGYGLLALLKNNLGQADEAIQLIEKGMELNPYYTWDYLYNLGRAYYALESYETAIEYLLQAIERNEAVYFPRLYLTASYVRQGEMDEAEWQITELEVLNSNVTLTHLKKVLPFEDVNLRSRLFEDLETAGMAE